MVGYVTVIAEKFGSYYQITRKFTTLMSKYPIFWHEKLDKQLPEN